MIDLSSLFKKKKTDISDRSESSEIYLFPVDSVAELSDGKTRSSTTIKPEKQTESKSKKRFLTRCCQ